MVCRVVSSYLGDLVALDGGDFVHGHVSGERNGEIISQGENFAALVLQVVNQLGVLAIFPG